MMHGAEHRDWICRHGWDNWERRDSGELGNSK